MLAGVGRKQLEELASAASVAGLHFLAERYVEALEAFARKHPSAAANDHCPALTVVQ